MAIVQHVKIVSPQPRAVATFLDEIVGVEGVQEFERSDQVADPTDGPFTWERVMHLRGANQPTGFIVGTPSTRQFQILGGDQAHIWGTAIATRGVDVTHARCIERGVEVTEVRDTAMGGRVIRAFFARVGGVVFEIMQVL